MPIPDFQSAMLPVLQSIQDGQEHHVREIQNYVAKVFQVTDSERDIMLPSGSGKLFINRVGWTLSHLKIAELVQSSRRSHYIITPAGKQLLASGPTRIDLSVLRKIKAYEEKRQTWSSSTNDEHSDEIDQTQAAIQTPDELLESGYFSLREELAGDLITRIKECSPEFFENLVLDLLIKLGYGGSQADRATVLGKSGDDGVDGVIKEDKLGLDVIYVQAKRWEGSVGQPEIQKFAGALQGQRAKKGIFITTSTFSKPALDYVQKIETRIVLIDGITLASLMIDHDVAVSVKRTFVIKKLDTDYFSDEE